ncbi:sensor histidine kinase [Streptomyces sp. CMB-StM0423]|uniref:sensor histidine kinase n=1 Tax=Streptomyces sp. CMB-StM0423 TaxID=2059884 RepID=UPI000C712AED|nr:histidine kinase [Streptomyces sp. CMB-StM0423]AUH43690.1 histidine kinase [Streptomyces sp. CMB-StM0423]
MPAGVVRLRWAHLLLGGALLMPYFLLVSVALQVAGHDVDTFRSLGWQVVAYLLALPLVAVTPLAFPMVRTLETSAAQALCRVPGGLPPAGLDRSWAARRRTAGWFTLHVGLGALVSGATLAVPPMAVVLLATPFWRALRERDWGLLAVPAWTAPPLGLALLAGLTAAAAAAGVLLARAAPALLGPTPADRLAAAEERAADLARRNRLARELHDSVGHALSAVTLQASAARRVFDRDPDFVREALAAIEGTTRSAVAELDTVLGLLRQEDAAGPGPGSGPGHVPAPDLARDLDALLERTRAAGATVEADVAADTAALPGPASRGAYRIVQEGLGNALRHAGPVPVRLRIAVAEGELGIVLENDVPETARGTATADRGGRGLRGVAERARLLGGAAEAGPYDQGWRLTARLPL